MAHVFTANTKQSGPLISKHQSWVMQFFQQGYTINQVFKHLRLWDISFKPPQFSPHFTLPALGQLYHSISLCAAAKSSFLELHCVTWLRDLRACVFSLPACDKVLLPLPACELHESKGYPPVSLQPNEPQQGPVLCFCQKVSQIKI